MKRIARRLLIPGVAGDGNGKNGTNRKNGKNGNEWEQWEKWGWGEWDNFLECTNTFFPCTPIPHITLVHVPACRPGPCQRQASGDHTRLTARLRTARSYFVYPACCSSSGRSICSTCSPRSCRLVQTRSQRVKMEGSAMR